MGRFRNPRYAPEWLERKLSPSSFDLGLAPVAPEYSIASPDEEPWPRDRNGDPIPPPIPLPPPGPPIPA
jgi:hypothetical protein